MPAIAVKWKVVNEAVDDRYANDHRNLVLMPIYELLMRMPAPITRLWLEGYLTEVFDWFQSNKYPFGGNEIWLDNIYIVIRGDDELVAEMEVSDQKWQITQCMV